MALVSTERIHSAAYCSQVRKHQGCQPAATEGCKPECERQEWADPSPCSHPLQPRQRGTATAGEQGRSTCDCEGKHHVMFLFFLLKYYMYLLVMFVQGISSLILVTVYFHIHSKNL